MRIALKILASLMLGAVCGTAAMAFVITSPASEEFRSVTFEDLLARRQLNERLKAALDGGAALPSSDSRITLLAVGDVMLSRMVAQRMQTNGPNYPFEKMRGELLAANIAFGNLESPLADGPYVGPLDMTFRADPWAAAALADAGFDVVSLANNHLMNFGAFGLSETVRLLDEVGVAHAGAGQVAELARAPAIVDRGGLTFAFLAYAYDARDVRGGTVPLDVDLMREDIAAVRSRADFIIISMHAGTEYAPEPNSRQVEFAHAAVDAGADVVLGHHPHVVQTMEIYAGKHIFYSLGNFVFDQMWSEDTRQGLGIKLSFSQEGVEKIDYVPVIIDDFAQPRQASDTEATQIIDRLGLSLEN